MARRPPEAPRLALGVLLALLVAAVVGPVGAVSSRSRHREDDGRLLPQSAATASAVTDPALEMELEEVQNGNGDVVPAVDPTVSSQLSSLFQSKEAQDLLAKAGADPAALLGAGTIVSPSQPAAPAASGAQVAAAAQSAIAQAGADAVKDLGADEGAAAHGAEAAPAAAGGEHGPAAPAAAGADHGAATAEAGEHAGSAEGGEHAEGEEHGSAAGEGHEGHGHGTDPVVKDVEAENKRVTEEIQQKNKIDTPGGQVQRGVEGGTRRAAITADATKDQVMAKAAAVMDVDGKKKKGDSDDDGGMGFKKPEQAKADKAAEAAEDEREAAKEEEIVKEHIAERAAEEKKEADQAAKEDAEQEAKDKQQEAKDKAIEAAEKAEADKLKTPEERAADAADEKEAAEAKAEAQREAAKEKADDAAEEKKDQAESEKEQDEAAAAYAKDQAEDKKEEAEGADKQAGAKEEEEKAEEKKEAGADAAEAAAEKKEDDSDEKEAAAEDSPSPLASVKELGEAVPIQVSAGAAAIIAERLAGDDAAEARGPALVGNTANTALALADNDPNSFLLNYPPAAYDKKRPPPDEPVMVRFTNVVNHVTEVEDWDSTASLTYTTTLLWNDGRLNYEAHRAELKTGEEYVVLNDEDADRLWVPSLWLHGSQQLDVMRRRALVYPSGLVVFTTTNRAVTSVSSDVTWFPFDTTYVNVTLVVEGYGSSKVMLYESEDLSPLTSNTTDRWFLTEAVLPEDIGHWTVRNYTGRAEVYKFADGSTRSIALSTLELHRNPLYYVSLYFVPICGLVLLAGLSFWVTPGGSGSIARFAIYFGTMFTLMAFHYMMTEDLPKAGYLMWLDVYMFGAYVCVGIPLVFHCLGARLERTGDVDAEKGGSGREQPQGAMRWLLCCLPGGFQYTSARVTEVVGFVLFFCLWLGFNVTMFAILFTGPDGMSKRDVQVDLQGI